MEGDRHRQAGENVVGGVIKRVADGFGIAQRPGQHEFNRLEGIGADGEHDQPGDDEGEQDIGQGDQPDIGPARQAAA